MISSASCREDWEHRKIQCNAAFVNNQLKKLAQTKKMHKTELINPGLVAFYKTWPGNNQTEQQK